MRSHQIGFTLAELLVASVLGLFIIAGAASVFTANRETARIAERAQTNQETLSYVAQTISRVVRAGKSFKGTAGGTLMVNFPDAVPDGFRDCLPKVQSDGTNRETARSNSFTTAKNTDTGKYELLCQRDNDKPQALVDGLAPILDNQPNFQVELLRPNPDIGYLGELQESNDDSAVAVRVAIRMLGPDGAPEKRPNSFIVTMRCAVLDCNH